MYEVKVFNGTIMALAFYWRFIAHFSLKLFMPKSHFTAGPGPRKLARKAKGFVTSCVTKSRFSGPQLEEQALYSDPPFLLGDRSHFPR